MGNLKAYRLMSASKKRRFFATGVRDEFNGKSNPYTRNSVESQLWGMGSYVAHTWRNIKRKASPEKVDNYWSKQPLLTGWAAEEIGNGFAHRMLDRFYKP